MTDPFEVSELERLENQLLDVNIFIERLEWEQMRLDDDMKSSLLKREQIKDRLKTLRGAE